jgi:pantoate kinase
VADINESKEAIEGEVLGIIDLERQVQQAEAELMKVPEFVQFVQLQKKVKRESDLLWETVQNAMEAKQVKKIAGDWG